MEPRFVPRQSDSRDALQNPVKYCSSLPDKLPPPPLPGPISHMGKSKPTGENSHRHSEAEPRLEPRSPNGPPEQASIREADENGEHPWSQSSQLPFPCPPPLEQSLAIVQGLQKPRSILKCGFSFSKAIKSKLVSIACKRHSPAEDLLQAEKGEVGPGASP